MALNSDARTDVEAVRWVLTRRAALALVIVVVSVLGMLRYSTYMLATQQEERNRLAKATGGGDQSGKDGGAGALSPINPDANKTTREANDELLISESGGKGYVSLG